MHSPSGNVPAIRGDQTGWRFLSDYTTSTSTLSRPILDHALPPSSGKVSDILCNVRSACQGEYDISLVKDDTCDFFCLSPSSSNAASRTDCFGPPKALHSLNVMQWITICHVEHSSTFAIHRAPLQAGSLVRLFCGEVEVGTCILQGTKQCDFKTSLHGTDLST